ncbi:hypothetical protein K474DRAFT_1669678 [Panus rudis PR-1116 ss-1]|nr:hypothetical protein K474DRAFT_1669678 [Panus rudis PR-1116 ss-1]
MPSFCRRYDSYVLVARHGHVDQIGHGMHCLHLIPEDSQPTSVEYASSSSSHHDPGLPRSNSSVRSKELIGTIKLSLDHRTAYFTQLQKFILKAYEENSAAPASTSNSLIDS